MFLRRRSVSVWGFRLLAIAVPILIITVISEDFTKDLYSVLSYFSRDRGPRYYHPECPTNHVLKQMSVPYGEVPDRIRNGSRVICNGKSKMTLYPGPLIEFDNVVLDFSRRHEDSAIGQTHLDPGFITFDCEPTEKYQFEKFTNAADRLPGTLDSVDQIIEEPVISLSRDDCGNTWHSMSDFIRVHSAGIVTGLAAEQRKILVIDDRLQIWEDPDSVDRCPYDGIYPSLGQLGVMRAISFERKKILFKKLVMPIDTGILSMIWAMNACDAPMVLSSFVDSVFKYHKLPSLTKLEKDRKAMTKSAPVRILFSSRRRKPFTPEGTEIGIFKFR